MIDGLVKGELARVERAAGFVQGRVEALLDQLVGAPPGEALDHVLARLETLEGKARQARQLLGEARAATPERALELLRAFDYPGMVAALRGLEPQVQRLAANGTAPLPRTGHPSGPPTGRQTGPMPARPTGLATGPMATPGPGNPTGNLADRLPHALTDRLKRFFGPSARALPTLRPPSQDQLALEAFDAGLRFMAKILAYVDPRLAPVRCALEVGDLHPNAPAVVQLAAARDPSQAVDERMRAWVAPLIRLFHDHPPVRRPAKVATTQWQQAHALKRQAEELAALAKEAGPEALQGLQAGKLRGAVMPLGHLHVTFKGIPHLQALFPPPSRADEAPRSGRGC
jgi:hypothetical protein